MKPQIIFVSDFHLYGPGEVFSTKGLTREAVYAKFVLLINAKEDDSVVLLGDLVDAKNCLKTRMSDARWVFDKIVRTYKQVPRDNHSYIWGFKLPSSITYLPCMEIAHGHRVFDSKFRKWEVRLPEGLAKWRFLLMEYTYFIRDFRRKTKLSKKDINKIRDYCDLWIKYKEIKFFVMGHVHPKFFIRHYDEYNNITYCVAPRGRKAFCLEDFLKKSSQ